MEFDLPEGEEVLDFLLAGGGADVLDVDGVGRHDGGEGVELKSGGLMCKVCEEIAAKVMEESRVGGSLLL